MSYAHLYYPAPCASWPAEQLEAVGEAFREAGAAGADEEARMARAVQAYRTAGGDAALAAKTVHDMLASLSRERGDWLWGPIEAWADVHRPPPDEGLPVKENSRC